MGRRKDDPQLQQAKGFPGRRKRKVEQELEAIAVAAEKSGTDVDPFPVPAEFAKAPAYWSYAIRLWKELSDIMFKQGRRRPAYRGALARYCWWMQQFFSCAEQLRKDLPKGGVTIMVKKGDGEYVPRTHPNIDFIAKAETALRLLDAEFGFTPMRDQDLIRTESFNAGQGRLPLGGTHPQSGVQRPASDDDSDADPMGLMNGADSPPPGARPN
ncbi:P27 family phage terminase small subunit [Brucella rhizosphaerae]|uniref:Phage terminase, small subunit n=1 Tax=Brucella rhizosphaerae TaxID=571254 RepID=A0A256FHG6_9HYPH|nr:P27 family phage terminase small subunit [Brucella rhizosphaerae]OYR14269.1 phage terminase, small subunit [Brucella rhizosphaerae]